MPPPLRTASSGAILLAVLLLGWATAKASCRATTRNTVTPVVELYTSEGCSSCPPADRWLSALPSRGPVVALAFHVDYWDRLGWSDRFARPIYTERQRQQQLVNGAAFSYTPQVLLDGVDRKDWQHMKLHAPLTHPAATVAIVLSGAGPQYEARVRTLPGGPQRLAAYWAVTENGHRSDVAAGENQGATLAHDHVVRELQPVAAWASRAGTDTTLRFTPSGAADGRHQRYINLVILDAGTARPVQALKLGC